MSVPKYFQTCTVPFVDKECLATCRFTHSSHCILGEVTIFFSNRCHPEIVAVATIHGTPTPMQIIHDDGYWASTRALYVV